jgi:cytochrome c biogenesis protein
MNRKEKIPNIKKNALWSLFSSVNLTIVLFILIVLLSIAGSLIPQQEAAREFSRRIPSGWASVLQKMQFFDLYHSIWFLLLLGLLSLNLIVCSLNRLQVTWQRIRAKAFPDSFTSLENLSPALTILTEERHDTTIQKLEALLKKKYRKVEKRETAQGDFLYGEKGRFSHCGVYLIHLSILIIIGGAVIGSLFGFDAYVQVAEGDTVDTIQLKGDKGAKKLNFTLRCDRFRVDFYEDGVPKEYRSDLTFLKNDSIAYQGSLLVNHPITFEGLRFYQASYGTVPDGHAQVQVLQIFGLDHMDRRYYTGLHVAYDPGLPLVAAGTFLVFSGFMVVFFSSHRQVWIVVETQGDRTRISITGRTNRDHRRLQKEMENVMMEYTKLESLSHE